MGAFGFEFALDAVKVVIPFLDLPVGSAGVAALFTGVAREDPGVDLAVEGPTEAGSNLAAGGGAVDDLRDFFLGMDGDVYLCTSRSALFSLFSRTGV